MNDGLAKDRLPLINEKGEVLFEVLIYLLVLTIGFYVFRKKIENEIKILEGLGVDQDRGHPYQSLGFGSGGRPS